MKKSLKVLAEEIKFKLNMQREKYPREFLRESMTFKLSLQPGLKWEGGN